MDLSIKPCSSTTTTTTGSLRDVRNRGDCLLLDRLTSLPLEVLIRILSLLPSKDAAATCLLSKRLRPVFPWLTSLDFDDSSISYCLSRPSRVERFPNYVTFVDNVLQEYQSQHLTRFRLQVGGQSRPKITYLFSGDRTCDNMSCAQGCYPHLSSSQIFSWISMPLTRHGLTELDLSIHVREELGSQLPPAIFMCETLESLKLDVNLGLDLFSTMPSFRLPNLKLLHLIATFISGDGFVTRLVSCCPLLEDLDVDLGFNHVHFTDISSSSLRRLHYKAEYFPDECDKPDLMLVNTPNLEEFFYFDNLALHYTISKMNSLVKAKINIGNELNWEKPEVSFQQMFNLIRPLSNTQHLILGFACTQGFVPGIIVSGHNEQLEMEHEFCITPLKIIPWCCRFHLKRIVVNILMGTEREFELIQFLLKHALVLEELVIGPNADRMTLESTLQNLPRASVSCSILFL